MAHYTTVWLDKAYIVLSAAALRERYSGRRRHDKSSGNICLSWAYC